VFEKAALTYDQDFTFSNIGRLLRLHVWDYLDTIIEPGSQLNILELNCGTGEDALRFAQKGHNIYATDLSKEMVNITRQKATHHKFQDKVDAIVCDSKNLRSCNFSSKFDLIFSNFGGLNCLNKGELENLSADLSQLLNSKGRFVSVVMPRFCLWESLYFLSKFDTQKIFRRNTHTSLQVNVGDEKIETWYYSPTTFKNIFQNHFKRLAVKPVGVAIPPSYMENRIGKNQKLMQALNISENVLGSISSLSAVSDHFLMDMERREGI